MKSLFALINLIIVAVSICTSEKIPLPEIKIFNETSLKLPLKAVNLDIAIQENVARIKIEQEYTNDLGKDINIEYLFPISDSAIFDHFEAQIGNKTIVGVIKEKQEAKKEFEELVSQGHTAGFTEIDDKSKDIMRCRIGNLLVNQTLIVRYSYLETLSVIMNKFWRLIVFSTLTERYNTPPESVVSKIRTVVADEKTYKWMIKASIESLSPITMLRIPSHGVDIEYNEDKTKAFVKLSKEYDPNRDFELYYSSSKDIDPKFYIEHYEYETVNQTEPDVLGYITFYPMFNKQSLERTWKLYKLARKGPFEDFGYFSLPYKNQVTEFIFVADRSGSMGGKRIVNLRQALITFLKRLPDDCLFNIVSFGSMYNFMYEKSQSIKEKKEEAISIISAFNSDLGGTEIYSPLKAIYDTHNPESNIPKVIYVLTDGDVGNADAIIRLVKVNRNKARVLTIGIGSGTSNYLIKSVAKAGGGKYEFVRDEDNLGEKVKFMITSAISPYLTDVKISFGEYDEFVTDIQPKTNEVPFILKDEPFKLYFILKKDYPSDLRAHISYFDSSLNMRLTATIAITKKFQGTIVHKIFAKNKIEDLIASQESNEFDKDIVDLSLKYQVLSTKTAFIMLIQENNKKSEAEEVFVPNIQSGDYDIRYGGSMPLLQMNSSGGMHTRMAKISGPKGFTGQALADSVAMPSPNPQREDNKIPKSENNNDNNMAMSQNNPDEMNIDPLAESSSFLKFHFLIVLIFSITLF